MLRLGSLLAPSSADLETSRCVPHAVLGGGVGAACSGVLLALAALTGCEGSGRGANEDRVLPAPSTIPAAARGAVGAHMPTARAALPRIPVALAPVPSAKPNRRNDAGVAQGSEGVPL